MDKPEYLCEKKQGKIRMKSDVEIRSSNKTQVTTTYRNAKSCIRKLFLAEQIAINKTVMEDFLDLLSVIHMYEEEGKKILPELIVGTGLTTKDFEKVTQCSTIVISGCSIKDNSIKKMLKPIIPFCDNDWRVFISIDNNFISFGILRSFLGPASMSITDSLIDSSNEVSEIRYILVDVLSKTEILLRGAKGNKVQINFGFVAHATSNRSELSNNLVADLLKDSKPSHLDEKQKQAFTKLIEMCSKRGHGAILLVVNASHDICQDSLLEDGIIFSSPIDLLSSLSEALTTPEILSTAEKYYALSGLFLMMLNTDGITAIDTQGRILGYNIFIKSDKKGNAVAGGARKRAAQTLINSKNSNYCGVYFQSQDGDITYERIITT